MSMPQYAIISTSHRPGAESLRLSGEINQRFFEGEADVIDLFAADLPFWNGERQANDSVLDVQARISAADGLVFVVPEWHGMAPAGLKNLFLWCNHPHFAHKPALLVGVSASVGGAFVIAELRSSGYKNSRLLWLPEHLILRNAGDLWNGTAGESEEYLQRRAAYAVTQLKTYTEALAPARATLLAGLDDFPNGMS
ncbi:NAD(P)H-dependent oxidoreductase [uncultured Thalassolituus sp.]|uniref:NADPH-dependent FMN reductase n=1 Tax=uncultured Thalassolituus sp. TaxID=285273 RepID=UPI002618B427|nr:NAD(P)H-dependent oxidoreductase [uncultured Thalassolituus sp.]